MAGKIMRLEDLWYIPRVLKDYAYILNSEYAYKDWEGSNLLPLAHLQALCKQKMMLRKSSKFGALKVCATHIALWQKVVSANDRILDI